MALFRGYGNAEGEKGMKGCRSETAIRLGEEEEKFV